MVLTIPVSLVIGLAIGYWWGRHNGYWTGRNEGCQAIETMVYDRIKENYPDTAKDMWDNLLR